MKCGLVSLCLIAIVASDAGAEPPPNFLRTIGSYGTLDGQFLAPIGIACDPLGNIYVTDRDRRNVQKFDPQGNFLLGWNPPNLPTDVAVSPDGSIVYVSMPGTLGVQKYTSSGVLLGQIGPVRNVSGIWVDHEGLLYVAEHYDNRVRKFTADGFPVANWILDPEGCTTVVDVAVDATLNVYVAEYSCNRISKFSQQRDLLAQWGSAGTGEGQFNVPRAIAVDPSGNVFVSDWNNYRVQKFTTDGLFLSMWGRAGQGDGEFGGLSPMNLTISPSGDILVCDLGNARIQVFNYSPVSSAGISWGALKAHYR